MPTSKGKDSVNPHSAEHNSIHSYSCNVWQMGSHMGKIGAVYTQWPEGFCGLRGSAVPLVSVRENKTVQPGTSVEWIKAETCLVVLLISIH